MTTHAYIVKIAERRATLHVNRDPAMAPIIDGYEEIGLYGEVAFGEFCGQCPNFLDRRNGDGGIDFTVPLLYTVDVKTSENAGNLLHDSRKPVAADIYVLAELAGGKTTLLGWEWGKRLARTTPRDFGGHGIPSHHIPRESLRPMRELDKRIWRVGR